jgi:hypothetical protein
MIGILERVFGCSHKRTTFPISRRTLLNSADVPKLAYVACLECGMEFDYDWKNMKIGRPAPSRQSIVSALTPENTAPGHVACSGQLQ